MRELPISEDMKTAITRVNNGESVDFDKIAVFEARSLNTRPLRRKGGLFEAAVTDPSVLSEMASTLNASNEGVPLHIMHNTEMLNTGKLFRARVDKAHDGHDEITTQFYIPRDNASLLANLNSGVTDQVSVGVQAREIKCSKCDFDYRKGGMENVLLGQCSKKHVIGKDGTHVKLIGLDKWGELSLVDRGAAADARVVSAANSRFNTESMYSLVANQNELATSIPLIANLDDITGEETNQVDEVKLKELLAATLSESNTAHTEALAALQAKLTEAEGKLTAAEAARDTATGQVTTLTAERDTARTERDTVKAEFAEAETFLKEQATKAQVAAGVKSPVEVANFKDAITKITESGVNLVNLFARDKTATNVEHNHEVALTASDSVRGFQRRKETN